MVHYSLSSLGFRGRGHGTLPFQTFGSMASSLSPAPFYSFISQGFCTVAVVVGSGFSGRVSRKPQTAQSTQSYDGAFQQAGHISYSQYTPHS